MYSKEINLFESKLNFNSNEYFLKFKNLNLSYRDFKNIVLNQKNHLAKKNLAPQSLVLIHLIQPVELLSTVFACMSLNLKPCLANSFFNENQVDKILSENVYALVINEFQNETPEDSAQATYDDFFININSEIIFYSSGSVSPKACALTLKSLFFNALGSSKNIPFEKEDCWGLCLPLFHVGGFSIVIRTLLAQASTYILDNGSSISEQIIENRISHISQVSTQFYRFLEEQKSSGDSNGKSVLDSLKCILLGGSAISEEKVFAALKLHLPVYKSYGMTEMGSQICTTNEFTTKSLSSSGKILPYRDLKIQNQRIYVKGPCLFKGYYIDNEIQKVFDENGWFDTKDLGTVENHEIKIIGRSDRVFQSGGENISPEFIEKNILEIDGVLKVKVMPIDDVEYGKRAVAYLQSNRPLEEVDQLISKRLSGFLRPKELRNWDSEFDSWKS